jgi:predicted nuclease of predicted toxin-antitoxin system
VRLLADENVPGAAVQALRTSGHDVSWVRTAAPGASDVDVLAKAGSEDRLLLTFDKDFGELAFRRGLPAASGIILLRIPLPSSGFGEHLVRLLESRHDWAGHFSVVTDDRIRMVPLPTARTP